MKRLFATRLRRHVVAIVRLALLCLFAVVSYTAVGEIPGISAEAQHNPPTLARPSAGVQNPLTFAIASTLAAGVYRISGEQA
jgi:hypothetical protein